MSVAPLYAVESALPTPRTPLVGRGDEIAAARGFLLDEAVPLLTLTGTAGVGKTRLALAVALDTAGAFADGVVFVDLSPLRDPVLVLPAVAQALGVAEAGGRSLQAGVVAFLRSRQVLLVLDNFEQVLPAAAAVADLLVTCPAGQVLVTSRAPLRVSGEQEFPVAPLVLPDPTRLPPLGELAATAAVALFVQRARAVHPGFALTETNAPTVVEVCRRVDGLPLAIELAAVRTKLLSPQALLALLNRRLQVLTSGVRDAPARQRTLRDAIAWSHDLLTVEERALFRRLGVFVGGFDLEAAGAVAGGDPLVVVDRLSTLVNQSLLRRDGEDGKPRFAMLETIREYALDQLVESGEEDTTRDAHAAYFLALAERVGVVIKRRTVTAVMDQVEPDRANLRAALARLNAKGRYEEVLRIALNVSQLWELRGPAAELLVWMERAADPTIPVAAGVRGWALWQGTNLVHRLGDITRMASLADLGIRVFREYGEDPAGLAACLVNRGIAAVFQGDQADAVGYQEEAVAIFRRLGDERPLGRTVANFAGTIARGGDYARAEPLMEEAFELGRRSGDAWGMGLSLTGLAIIAYFRGQYEQALVRYREALATDLSGDRLVLSSIVNGVGVLAARQGWVEIAVHLFGAEAMLRDHARPSWLAMAAERERWTETAQAVLGQEAFESARAAGCALSPAAAVDTATAVADDLAGVDGRPETPQPDLRSFPPASITTASHAAAFGLSPRERDVLACLVRRETAREIAAQFSVSERTVEHQVASIYNKLGVNSRREAAAVALRCGLA